MACSYLRFHAIAYVQAAGMVDIGPDFLDLLEVFSGIGCVTEQFRSVGRFNCQPFDWERGAACEARPQKKSTLSVYCDIHGVWVLWACAQDLLTVRGFLKALAYTLKLRRHSVLYGGVPCSTWETALAASTHNPASAGRSCLLFQCGLSSGLREQSKVMFACALCLGLHQPGDVAADSRAAVGNRLGTMPCFPQASTSKWHWK